MADLGTSCPGKTHFHLPHTLYTYISPVDEKNRTPPPPPTHECPCSGICQELAWYLCTFWGCCQPEPQSTVVITLGILNESRTNGTTSRFVPRSNKCMLFSSTTAFHRFNCRNNNNNNNPLFTLGSVYSTSASGAEQTT